MAILLLMAANYTLDQRKKQLLMPDVAKQEPIVENKEETDVKETTEELINDSNTADNPDTSDSTIQPDPKSEPSGRESTEGTNDLQETVTETTERDIVPLQSAGTIDIITSVQDQPASIIDDEELAKVNIKKVENKEIVTEGITLACDVGGGYIEYNNHLFQKDALKEIKPELFSLRTDSPTMPSSSFGTYFPKIAKKKDIFVRVDVIPNRVYRFEGTKWIEINKDLSSTYLYDQEYIKYLVDKIDKGEYDVDLLSDQEKIQIEDFLSSQNS
jgi:hypothetical protein